MKKILIIIGLSIATVYAYGQGQIGFQNSTTTLISTNTVIGGPATGPISGLAGTAYYFALFVAPSGTLDPAMFTLTGAYGSNTPTAGRLIGGFPSISGYPPGSTVSLLVRGWSANIASVDYGAVANYLANPTFIGWYGESQIATLWLGGGAIPSTSVFGTGPGHILGFTLEMRTVPEPSLFAFAGLGTAALWLFRRR